MRQKLRIAAAAAATIAGAMAALAAGAGIAQAAGDLYVQQAGGGTLTARRLVLTDVAPRTTVFSDRPQRMTSITPLRRVVDGWDRAFGDVPPNAALEIHDAPAGRDVAIVVLQRPRYDARRRTLTFAVSHLGSSLIRRSAALRHFGRRADGRSVTRFGRVSLFIDDAAGYSPLMMWIKVPPSSTVVFESDIAMSFDAFGTLISSFHTPTLQNGSVATGTGSIDFRSWQIRASATQSGSGMDIAFLVGVHTLPEGETLTGTTSIPPGGSITVAIVGARTARRVQLPNGRFSIPYPAP